MAKIVSCDDDADISRIISATLKNAGHEIFIGTNGEEGIDLVIETEPDLVITDVEMPKMNGYEFVKKLRSSSLTKNIPIIMLSGLSKEDERVYGLEQGADDYLTKPFSAKELKLKVELLLQRTNELRALKGDLATKKSGKIITFMGAKGGTGTTTITINTVLSIKNSGKEICACDLNNNSGVFNFLLNTPAEKTIEFLLREDVLDLDKELLESYLTIHKESNLKFLSSHKEIKINSCNIHDLKKIQKILSLMKSYFEFVIIDAGSDINLLSSAIIDVTDTLILCLNLDLLSLTNLKSLTMFFEKNEVDLNKVKILVNNINTYSNLKSDVIKKVSSLQLIEEITNDGVNFTKSLNDGKPFITLFPKAKSTEQIQGLAAKIMQL